MKQLAEDLAAARDVVDVNIAAGMAIERLDAWLRDLEERLRRLEERLARAA